MLGRRSTHADVCKRESFIGVDFLIQFRLEGNLPENWRDFNKYYIPKYLDNHPGKSKIATGLACEALHTVCKGIKLGHIILSPDGGGNYLIGKVKGDYFYKEGNTLLHRINMSWYPKTVSRAFMSQALQYQLFGKRKKENSTFFMSP